MSETSRATAQPGGLETFRQEFIRVWHSLPDKTLFFCALLVWLALFQFLGNSTFGYKGTPSLFYWMQDMYKADQDNEHGFLIPFVVLALFWWKRKDWLTLPKAPWWPAFALLGFAILLHILGYVAQQARISVMALFVGVYALLGMVWGWQMMRVTFFPFFLFIFCLPLSGGPAETITLPLRFFATKLTQLFSSVVLGINVIQHGTTLTDPSGRYQYEVAAACSGMRSLLATSVMAIIYAFVLLKSPWRRALMIVSSVPLAIASNVIRLTAIIIAAEAFGGQDAGHYVHESSWMSKIPYVVAIGGVLLLGHWLRENKPRKSHKPSESILPGVENCP